MTDAGSGAEQPPIDIEAIQHELREEIRSRLAHADLDAPQPRPQLSPHLHEALLRTELQIERPLLEAPVDPAPLPIFGRMLDPLRNALRRMILRYVDASAQRQIEFNAAAAQTLHRLVAALEDERRRSDAEIAALRAEIEALRARQPERPE